MQNIQGGLRGLFVGAGVTSIAALIGTLLFYQPSGAIVDYGAFIILVFSLIWGAFSGAMVGFLLLREIESAIAGLVLAFGSCLFYFLSFSVNSNSVIFHTVVIMIITGTSSYIISTVNSFFSEKEL